MYKVTIVENEDMVRNAMIKRIDWAKLGMEVVDSVADGATALERIAANPPDIVITDIRMPKMDGLELCRNLCQRFPSIYVIILSGYDKFQYAQEAIRFGVKEYLLKPITPYKLTMVLQETHQRLTEIRRQNQLSEESVQLNEQRSLDTRCSLLACELCYGLISAEQACMEGRQLGFNLEMPCYTVVAIYNQLSQNDSVHHEWISTIKRELQPHCRAYDDDGFFCYVRESRDVVLYLAGGCEREVLKDRLQTILTQTIQTVNRDEAQHCVYKMADFTGDLSLIFKCTRQLIADVERKLKKPSMLEMMTYEQKQHMPDRGRLITYLQTGAASEIDTFITSYLSEEMKQCITDLEYGRLLLFDARLACFQVAQRCGFAAQLDAEEKAEVYPAKPAAAEDVLHQLRVMIMQVLRLRDTNAMAADKQSMIIHTAMQYMQENLCKSDLNLQSVADHVHLSANYFGILFKQQTSMSFVRSLTRMKMERACMLLRTTDMSIKEIARQAGYSDEQYFCKVFKKEMNTTPGKFRTLR